ncbi:MAG TPA: class I tRNA ligase family protein, partial [Pseudonocardiaceae bacterium]
GSRRFGTKLWNATRFAMANGATADVPVPPRDELTDADRWILAGTDQLVSEVDADFDSFEFARLADRLYHFTWDEFCDWYLELAKVQIAAGGTRAEATRAVLGRVLDVVLRLLHPVMPFVTERLWTALTGGESLVVAAWPTPSGEPADAESAERIEALRKLVTEIRRFRGEQGLPPGRKVPAELSGACCAGLLPHEQAIRALSRLDDAGDGFAETASLEVALPTGKVTVRLDLSGVIDVEAERKRLAKDLAAAEKELKQCAAKLDNPQFTDRAPADVVAKITARRDTATAEIERLRTQLASLV